MKKVLSVLSLLVISLLLVACTETLAGVKSIELNKMPANVYELEAEVSLKDYELIVEFDNAPTVNLKLNAPGITVTGATLVGSVYFLNTSAVGDYYLVIEYEGYKVQFAYKVENTAGWDGVTTKEPEIVDNNYQVSSPAEYAWLVENYGQTATPVSTEGTVYGIKLTADLDFNGNHVESIPEVQAGFVFDGGGFELKNLGKSFSGLVRIVNLGEGGTVEFKNIKMLNLDLFITRSFGLLAYSTKSTKEGTAYKYYNHGKILATNIELSGEILTNGSINSTMFGYMLHTKKNESDTTKLVMEVRNTKNSVKMTSLLHNTGLYVGHGPTSELHIDDYTYNNTTGKVIVLPGVISGYFYGVTPSSTSDQVFSLGDTNVTTLRSENKTKIEESLTSVEIDSQFNELVSFKKSNNASLALVSLVYSVGNGYTRLISTTIDLSLFETGADVISSIKALRVTQDPLLKDDPNYHYNNEENAITSTTITVNIIQVDANGNVVNYQHFKYPNK